MAERPLKPKAMDRRARARNWAIFAVLAALVILFYVMTVVRMGGGQG
jgi:ferric-dicitrate binding protein FerR (iron transport regulator)